MALRTDKQGNYVISNEKDAKQALSLLLTLEGEISELEEEHGITEMRNDCAALKQAATQWAVENDVERFDVDNNHHATLVKQFFDSRFVGTADDLQGTEPAGVVPLRTILKKSFGKEKGKEVWMRVTRRIVDREALEEAISEGLLSVDEVAPSFVEREKKPYLRIFPTGE